MADHDLALREHLHQLLVGAHAHVDVLSAAKDFPVALQGVVPPGAAHSGWQLIEHMRIALRDLWDFSTTADYTEKKWPDDYWPASPEPPSEEAFEAAVRTIEGDLELFAKLVRNPKSQLFAPVVNGKKDQTLLREVLLAADHTAYHTGELVFLRRLLGVWKT